ncbi:uncharacterized protein N7459_006243 [Penicillium hispanicum]|uniref:uncharacterized protein n=1 Tax=Penicillium hispanicum TaxID=1080232 RepID=UPI0025419373|nr:uncharacterized protein N7459_006243 [Penicillium hispanicum]KAJ5580258.1 hypothetical protein N7459_006243 [Penicillium hispanicum]
MAEGEPPGLGWDVYGRISTLKFMQSAMRDEGGHEDHLPNIDAVLDAYRSGTLGVTGLCTYWSDGKPLCQPRLFDWDEFEGIYDKYDGSTSFWTEVGL